MPTILADLGERRILEELVHPRFPMITETTVRGGDDCAIVTPPSTDLDIVLSTDPCPTPIAFLLTDEKDYFHYGWLTVLINVSDLAAMGAQPATLLVSSIMPLDMLVSQYNRFLDGLEEASERWKCPVVGGNIKDGKEFSATGAIMGYVKRGHILRREGAAAQDNVYVIGEMGLFWSAVLSRLKQFSIPAKFGKKVENALIRPTPRLVEGMAISESNLASSCMDSSDGITGCLYTLARTNDVNIVVSSDRLVPSDVVMYAAQKSNMDAKKLMLSWGGWELLVTVPPQYVAEFEARMNARKFSYKCIGHVEKGCGNVEIEENGARSTLVDISSKRFDSNSYLTHGFSSYAEYLEKCELVVGK